MATNAPAGAAALAAWAVHLESERHASPHTLRAYLADVRELLAVAGGDPRAVRAETIRHWLRTLDGRLARVLPLPRAHRAPRSRPGRGHGDAENTPAASRASHARRDRPAARRPARRGLSRAPRPGDPRGALFLGAARERARRARLERCRPRRGAPARARQGAQGARRADRAPGAARPRRVRGGGRRGWAA